MQRSIVKGKTPTACAQRLHSELKSSHVSGTGILLKEVCVSPRLIATSAFTLEAYKRKACWIASAEFWSPRVGICQGKECMGSSDISTKAEVWRNAAVIKL